MYIYRTNRDSCNSTVLSITKSDVQSALDTKCQSILAYLTFRTYLVHVEPIRFDVYVVVPLVMLRYTMDDCIIQFGRKELSILNLEG
jgi:hypothetical protein